MAAIELHQKEDSDIYKTLEWMKAGCRPKREERVGTHPTIGNLWSQFGRSKTGGWPLVPRVRKRRRDDVRTPGSTTTRRPDTWEYKRHRESASTILLERMETRSLRPLQEL